MLNMSYEPNGIKTISKIIGSLALIMLFGVVFVLAVLQDDDARERNTAPLLPTVTEEPSYCDVIQKSGFTEARPYVYHCEFPNGRECFIYGESITCNWGESK
jgi:hypothetical protein